MSNLQVKNIPHDHHDRLRRLAKKRGRTVRDIVLEAVRHRLAMEEFQLQLEGRQPVELSLSAADLLAESRAERSSELDQP